MRTLDEVRRDIDAHPRPRVEGPRLADWGRTAAAAKAWDAANPAEAARWAQLLDEERQVQDFEQRARAASVDALRQQRRLEACGAGERQLAAALEPRETPALADVRAWLAGSRTWCLLCGNRGTGKSVAAVWAVVATARQGKVALYRQAPTLARLSSFDDASEIRRLKRADLLVIDDVGTENRTEHSKGLLFEVLDARHEAYLRTVLTSNLSPRELADRLGDRLADRVRSDCVAKQYLGASLRGAA